ncbi:MAG: UbiH/UbiF/VisC/COQ6 family ubiquinone biosynthesis hydroxylase [Rhodanobacteraceae bacterium]
MSRSDVVVVGGGVVGAASALALARAGLEVTLVEARSPQTWDADAEVDLRVFALAPSSARLLDNLGVWASVREARISPYSGMQVHDASNGASLEFDAAANGRECLGWIVENGLLVDRLWQALRDHGVRCHCPARVESVSQRDDHVQLLLADGTGLRAGLLVAADGARSPMRELAGIACRRRDYHQRGVVAHVRATRRHDGSAWQRFLPHGPLAMLPLADGRCSIVWTLPECEAQRVLKLDDAAFMDELGVASDFHLGPITETTPRAAFPLQLQLAQRYHAPRMVLVGDAAHVVHPLAGQGVNLGLRDVSELRDLLLAAREAGQDIAADHVLARYARRRRSADTLDAIGMDAIQRSFAWQSPALVAARGLGTRLANGLGPLKRALSAHAAGE